MRQILAALALASLALAGCTAPTPDLASTAPPIVAGAADAAGVPAPVVYGNRTAADERALMALEVFYASARALTWLAPASSELARATAALAAARAAYRTANAHSWLAALDHALATIEALRRAAGR